MNEKNSLLKTQNTYFINGLKYTTSVYCNGKPVKISKYFSDGKISQIYNYENGQLTLKTIYNRKGDIIEKISYSYYDYGDIATIISEKINSLVSVTFIQDEEHKIVNIRLRHNNLIIKKIDYEYSNSDIICTEVTQAGEKVYKLDKAPIAGEKWLTSPQKDSLVMRKLKVAMASGI